MPLQITQLWHAYISMRLELGKNPKASLSDLWSSVVMAIQPSICGSPCRVDCRLSSLPRVLFYISHIVCLCLMCIIVYWWFHANGIHANAVVGAFRSVLHQSREPRVDDRRFIKFKYPFNCHPEHKRPAQRGDDDMRRYARSSTRVKKGIKYTHIYK